MRCATCHHTLAAHPGHRACAAVSCAGCGVPMRLFELRRCSAPAVTWLLHTADGIESRCVPGPRCPCRCFVAETVEVLA